MNSKTFILDRTISIEKMMGGDTMATTTYFYVPTTTPFEVYATTSPEQLQTNIFHGFLLFLITAFLLVAFFTSKFKK